MAKLHKLRTLIHH